MEYMGLAVIPAIVGVLEALKTAGFPVRYVPLVSGALGIGFGIFSLGFTFDGLFVGLVLGLSAAGLYDLGKVTVLDR